MRRFFGGREWRSPREGRRAGTASDGQQQIGPLGKLEQESARNIPRRCRVRPATDQQDADRRSGFLHRHAVHCLIKVDPHAA